MAEFKATFTARKQAALDHLDRRRELIKAIRVADLYTLAAVREDIA
ncbi:hypothetical protein ACWIGI_28560 [Nocardia sp. NPDC055321]